MSINPAKAKKNLKKKGFRKESGKKKKRDHEYYFYYHNDGKTDCYTKFSSSHDTIDDSLLKRMYMALQMDNTKDVRDLLECPMTEERLIEILREKGSITD